MTILIRQRCRSQCLKRTVVILLIVATLHIGYLRYKSGNWKLAAFHLYNSDKSSFSFPQSNNSVLNINKRYINWTETGIDTENLQANRHTYKGLILSAEDFKADAIAEAAGFNFDKQISAKSDHIIPQAPPPLNKSPDELKGNLAIYPWYFKDEQLVNYTYKINRNSNKPYKLTMPCQKAVKPLYNSVETLNQWQKLQQINYTIFFLKSYYDNRKDITDIPVLHSYIIVSKDTFTDMLFCDIWYPHAELPVIVKPLQIVNLSNRVRIFKVSGIPYSQHLITCPLTLWQNNPSKCPTHVSFATSSCEPLNVLVPIYSPENSDEPVQDFAVCVAPQYGHLSDAHLNFFIEWIELNRLFGVGEINIYYSTLKASVNATEVLKYYENIGVLKVVQHQTPVKDYPPENEFEASQLGLRFSLNDCMMRNIHRYRYIIVLDRDEVIIPRTFNTYKQLLDSQIRRLPTFEQAPAISVISYMFLSEPFPVFQ